LDVTRGLLPLVEAALVLHYPHVAPLFRAAAFAVAVAMVAARLSGPVGHSSVQFLVKMTDAQSTPSPARSARPSANGPNGWRFRTNIKTPPRPTRHPEEPNFAPKDLSWM